MKQNMPPPGHRFAYYDVLKIAAAFMVCFYHLNMLDMGYSPEHVYLPNLNRMLMNLCAMSVPLFFMVNGALLLRRPYSLFEILARFFKLCLLYVFWSIMIQGILSIIFEGRPHINARVILLGGSHYISHLWFLKTSAILTLLTPLLYRLLKSEKRFALYALLLILLIFPFLYNYMVLAGRLLNISAFFYLNRTGAGTMYSLVYFILGRILVDHVSGKTPARSPLLCWLLLTGWLLVTVEGALWTNINHAVFDSVNASFPTIGALFMAVGMFMLIARFQTVLSPRLQKSISFVGGHVLGIYLLHPIFTHLLRYALSIRIPAIATTLLTAIIMAVTLFISAVLRKIPLIRRLLSV